MKPAPALVDRHSARPTPLLPVPMVNNPSWNRAIQKWMQS